MKPIVETIRNLVAEHIGQQGIVLWFDPERHYERIVQDLECGQEQTLFFDGSFYKLRLEVEPHLRGTNPPKLLVYIPIPWEQAEEPLSELISFGTCLRPGIQGSRNTRLAVVARKALKGRVPDVRLEDLDKQIEQGRITLDELERFAEDSGGSALPTALVVHFGTALIEDAALEFLSRPERDSELKERNVVEDWAKALFRHYGVLVNASSATLLRDALARQVLAAELLEICGEEPPSALSALAALQDPVVRRRAAELSRQWRDRRDLVEGYCSAALDVEQGLHLEAIPFPDPVLEQQQTFRCLERRWLIRIAEQIPKNPGSAAIALQHQQSFWAEQDSQLKVEWTLVAHAGRLLQRAAEIEQALRSESLPVSELIERYTGNANWAELDTLQRHLERSADSPDFALANPAAEIEQLIHAARRRHEEVAGYLAERFIKAWQADGFSAAGRIRQTEIFERFVQPELRERRTAYILVDALRWELARELPEILGADFETQMEVAIGTAPAITEVGMAALLPSASSGLEIAATPKLEVRLHGDVLKNRQDRMHYLSKRVKLEHGIPVIDLRLEDPRNFRRKLKDLSKGPVLIAVTSREIDQSGEDEMTTAREQMERVLRHLSLAIRKLSDEGVERFVIATDHGYLYGEDLVDSEKIDPPGDKKALCHRRVWVGQGGAASESYLLTEVRRFGASSELELAAPWNLFGFRTAGPTAYFHGGLAPQEILLPVIVAIPKTAAGLKEVHRLAWDLSLGSAKITTRFLSVRVAARSQGLFAQSWPSVRVEVRSGSEVCAAPVSASYGFQETTGSITLRPMETDSATAEPNTVALMLTSKAPSRGRVSIHLMDAATNVELKKLENVEVSIAI